MHPDQLGQVAKCGPIRMQGTTGGNNEWMAVMPFFVATSSEAF